jgi:SAM-dependent methyltransferase
VSDPTSDVRRLFTERRDFYARFIRMARYPHGLRAYSRASALLRRPGLRVLEAGCGTGALTFAVYDAAVRHGVPLAALDAFDLTPAMLERTRQVVERRALVNVRLAEANVLQLAALPEGWSGYDLVVSASMLEYVPRERFAEALAGLRARLHDGGTLVLFVTRRNPMTRVMIGRLWRSHLYSRTELSAAFGRAGFVDVRFPGFPLPARHLSLWGHVVEATVSAPARPA